MTNFSTKNYPSRGSGSYGLLLKGLLLSMAMVLFQFTQVHAQVNTGLQAPTKVQDSPNTYIGDGIQNNSDLSQTEAKIFTLRANSEVDFESLANPDLPANIDCANLRVVLVLDESGSIKNRHGDDEVREATLALAAAFQGSPAYLTIIEFDSQARIIDLGGNVVTAAFIANLTDYLYNSYNSQSYNPNSLGVNLPCPIGFTNWEDAFLTLIPLDPNLVLFLTDGEPSGHNVDLSENSCGYVAAGNQANFEAGLAAAVPAANIAKENGAHIFAIGVGDYIDVANLIWISDDENFGDNGNIFTDDYSIGSFQDLADDLTAAINAVCGTEISISKTVDIDQVCNEDQVVTFTLTVENTGGNNNFDAVSVTVMDSFPAYFMNLAIVGAPITGAELDGQKLTYEVGNLAPNESASIQVQATLSGPNGNYPNTAEGNAVNANRVFATEIVEMTDITHSYAEVSSCGTYEWKDNEYTASGLYVVEGFNPQGCPSKDTLNLVINVPTFGDTTAVACGEFTWYGNTYYVSDDYIKVFPGVDGKCDSTATLHLTINPASSDHQYVTTCEFPYVYNFEEYYTSQIIATVFPGEDGECDYTFYLHLSIGNPGDVCDDGDPLTFNDTITADCGCEGTPNTTVDCAGVVGGSASLDECGVCSGGDTGLTPNESCTDCAGVVNGTASLDECGVCSGGDTGLTPNESCTDCAGVVNGTASLDECGVCSGGNTGLIPNESCTDCAGVINGTASLDECGVCSGGNTGLTPNESCTDCAGVINGTASLDECGVCSGGNTGLTPNESCTDCAGVINGTASLDECGVCSGGDTGIDACVADCNGDFGGTAYYDDCQICVGGNTGLEPCVTGCTADAGSVTFGDGSVYAEFCATDNVPSTFTFDTPIHWNTSLFTRGIVTDPSGNILFITDDQVFVESYDFDIFGAGTLYLYVLNFDNSQSNISDLSDIFAGGGVVNIADFEGCFDLSNQLEAIGSEPTESSEVVASCAPYEWKGTVYTESGLYSYVDESGVCPHTFNLDLTIGGPGCNVEGDCLDFSTYYISHGAGIAGSNIYKVNFVGTDAILNLKFSTTNQSHIAIDAVSGIAYMVDEAGTGLEAYDLGTNAPIGTLALAPGLSKITAVAFNPTDGLVYVGDMNLKKIFTIDPNGTGNRVFYANAPVSGGDIAFQNGKLYLATKTGNKLYKVVQNGSAVALGNIPAKVNGIAAANNATDFIVSNLNSTQMTQISAANGAVQNTFDVILDGEIFTLLNGDLTSGCGDSGIDIVGCYGFEVLEFNQGLLTNGNPVGADRSDPDKALGEPDRSNAAGGFVSLGVGGSITIGFAGIVNDAPGNDIKIWETSFKGDVCGGAGDERADIELSDDGVNFIYVATICLDGEVDMASVGLTSVSHIRITNAATTTTPDGYDLDGVEAIYGCSNNPVIVNGDCYATEVLEYNQGLRSNGGAIAADRTIKSKALGAPQRSDAMNFVTLGYGGSIVLAFDGAVPNLAGADIEVVETTYNFTSVAAYPEFADVYVSVNGNNWNYAGTVDHANRFIDITNAGPFAFINYVKIVNNDAMSNTDDAYDLDGVVAIHNCIEQPAPRPFVAVSQSELTSYPNPTSGSSKVVFTTGETTRTLVEVYDMNGRNVATLFNAEAQQGEEYRLDFDGAALPNGVYIYRMTTDNETIIEKFMIAK